MKKVIVTGGGGFVGKALAFKLTELGCQVYSLARNYYPELEAKGIKQFQYDLSQEIPEEVEKIFPEIDCIFHVAAYVKMWGNYQKFFDTNVLGTKRLLELAKKYQVSKFIYTSSPSVIADGNDLKGIDESYPYPKNYKAFYPQTKAQAEQIVLAANSESLKTVSLRPHLIWGPGDTNFVPTILERAQSGKLICVGDGENKVDVCYIEDCVAAHIAALNALDQNPEASGKAYFITQGQPVKLWEWINQVLKLNRVPEIKKKISFKLAYKLASLLEFVHNLLPGRPEPRLTKFLVSEMATDHYFDISSAKELLGFEPKYTVEQALKKTFG